VKPASNRDVRPPTRKSKTMTTTTPRERRALHAFLTADAHEAFHQYAGRQGVSVSALLESIGMTLHDGAGRNLNLPVLVDVARMVDADNRRRKDAIRKPRGKAAQR
jgi:hypothetical protein